MTLPRCPTCGNEMARVLDEAFCLLCPEPKKKRPRRLPKPKTVVCSSANVVGRPGAQMVSWHAAGYWVPFAEYQRLRQIERAAKVFVVGKVGTMEASYDALKEALK